MPQTERTALSLLRKLTGDRSAVFRPHELKAIQALVRDRRRVLLVQRTGWGKSAVYFIATRLLRDDRAGPTMLMSPLLALMRNQIGFGPPNIGLYGPANGILQGMPKSTTIKVSVRTRDALRELAAREGLTFDAQIAKLVRRERRRIIGAQLASAPLDADDEAVLDASASDVAAASG